MLALTDAKLLRQDLSQTNAVPPNLAVSRTSIVRAFVVSKTASDLSLACGGRHKIHIDFLPVAVAITEFGSVPFLISVLSLHCQHRPTAFRHSRSLEECRHAIDSLWIKSFNIMTDTHLCSFRRRDEDTSSAIHSFLLSPKCSGSLGNLTVKH